MRCWECGKTEGVKRCLGCAVAAYCGVDHQFQGWPAHKAQCACVGAVRRALFPPGRAPPGTWRDRVGASHPDEDALERLDRMQYSFQATLALLRAGDELLHGVGFEACARDLRGCEEEFVALWPSDVACGLLAGATDFATRAALYALGFDGTFDVDRVRAWLDAGHFRDRPPLPAKAEAALAGARDYINDTHTAPASPALR